MYYTEGAIAARVQAADRNLSKNVPPAIPSSELLQMHTTEIALLDGIAKGIPRSRMVEPFFESLKQLNNKLDRFFAKIRVHELHQAIFLLIRSGTLHPESYLEDFDAADIQRRVHDIRPLPLAYIKNYTDGHQILSIANAHGVNRAGVSQALTDEAHRLGFRDKLQLGIACIAVEGFPKAILEDTELEVLKLLGRGLTYEEVGVRIDRNKRTAKRLALSAYRKLYVSLPSQAILRLVDEGTLQINDMIPEMSEDEFKIRWTRLTPLDIENLYGKLYHYIKYGDSYETIGKDLGLSPSTIESTILNIKKKLGITGPAIQLAMYWRKAQELGLI